jgi:hypothetical protein
VTKGLDLAQTKLTPYLARQISEKISSRVAECTRLILIMDEFGGDLRALDQRVEKHGKDTRI